MDWVILSYGPGLLEACGACPGSEAGDFPGLEDTVLALVTAMVLVLADTRRSSYSSPC